MTATVHVWLILAVVGAAYSAVTIPDSVTTQSTKLVYYKQKGTFYQAQRLCNATGGRLVLVDGPAIVDKLNQLVAVIGALSDIHTRMVRHDDEEFYTDDDECGLMDTSNWSWENTAEASYDANKQCVLAKGSNFKWKKRECDMEDEFVCNYKQAPCNFQMTSVSLASVPVTNASMAKCQATCRQMIGCFATAPSGHATLPPYTHCLFIVTGDYSNNMTTLSQCEDEFLKDETLNAATDYTNSEDPGKDPNDCKVSQSTTSTPERSGQRPLMDFLQDYNNTNADTCTETVILVSTEVATIHVTATPDVITMTPEVQTSYVTVTATPDAVVQTAYVTLEPVLSTKYVTVSPSQPGEVVVVETAYVTTTPAPITVTTTVVTAAAPPATQTTTVELMVTVTASGPPALPCSSSSSSSPSSSPAPLPQQLVTTTTTTTVPHTVIVTQTDTHTLTATRTVVSSSACPPQPSLLTPSFFSPSSCPEITPTTLTTTTTVITSTVTTGNSAGVVNKTVEEVLVEMEAVVKELTVNPANVSRSRRKKESAPDGRKSATGIGAGAVVFLSVVGFIVAFFDLSNLYHKIKLMKSGAS